MMPWMRQLWLASSAINWVEVGILAACVCVGLLAIGLWILSVWGAWMGWRRKQQAVFPLSLTSESNLQTNYQLRIELGNLQKSVIAFWLQDSRRLPRKTIKHYRYVEAPVPQVQAPIQMPGKASRPAREESKEKRAAKEGAKKISTFANLVASITGTLASLLPGPLKAPFKTVNQTIRAEQKSVMQVKSETDRINSSTRSLNVSMKRLGKETGLQDAGPKTGMTQNQVATQAPEIGQRVVVTEIPVTETDPLKPSQSSICMLILQPRNPFQSLSGSFQVSIQPVELKSFPLYSLMPSQTFCADLKIRAAWLYSTLFVSLVLTAGLLCVWASVTLIRWLLLFR